MDVLECIRTRRSVRSFKSKQIENETLNKILESATLAPSSGNLQNWEFVIVKEKRSKEELVNIALGQNFIAEAPIVVIVCSNQKRISVYGERGDKLYSIQNTAAAIQNLLLAAWSFGIGSCWVGAFDEKALSGFLKLPEHIRPVAMIPLGYPDEKPIKPKRSEGIFWLEKYGSKA